MSFNFCFCYRQKGPGNEMHQGIEIHSSKFEISPLTVPFLFGNVCFALVNVPASYVRFLEDGSAIHDEADFILTCTTLPLWHQSKIGS